MRYAAQHARIPYSPFAESLRNARLDSLREEPQGGTNSLVLDYQELFLDTAPELVLYQGALAEYLYGHYVPRRLHFSGITKLKRTGLYAVLDNLPLDHPARSLQGMLYWYPPEKAEPLFLLLNASTEPAELLISARHCVEEARPGLHTAVSMTRLWSSPPPLRPGLVPYPRTVWRRYGGDPITVRLGKRRYHRRFLSAALTTSSRPGPRLTLCSI